MRAADCIIAHFRATFSLVATGQTRLASRRGGSAGRADPGALPRRGRHISFGACENLIVKATPSPPGPLRRLHNRLRARRLERRGDLVRGTEQFWDLVTNLAGDLMPGPEWEIPRDLFVMLACA